MSRIGRLPIVVPSGVKIRVDDNEITVVGPKGELKQSISPDIAIELNEKNIIISRTNEDRETRALHGLYRSLISNMVQGVTKGFTKELDLVGVGYRVQMAGPKLVIRAGFSHQVEIEPLDGVTLGTDGATKIKVSGIDKAVVGQMASNIRGIKPVDSFKGKGIKYTSEVIHLKAGKTGKAIGSK